MECVFLYFYTCIKTGTFTNYLCTFFFFLSFLANVLSCVSVGAACSMGLRGQGRRWWLEHWLTNAVRVSGRFPSSCERELTASANGWGSQNDSSAFSLTRFACPAGFVLLGSNVQLNVID